MGAAVTELSGLQPQSCQSCRHRTVGAAVTELSELQPHQPALRLTNRRQGVTDLSRTDQYVMFVTDLPCTDVCDSRQRLTVNKHTSEISHRLSQADMYVKTVTGAARRAPPVDRLTQTVTAVAGAAPIGGAPL